ncbi:MAG: hypothetical protein ACL9RN_01245 [Cylindrospermopsis raciborskii]|nr:hypothetical protein [Cylindrospermopsis raciborskii]
MSSGLSEIGDAGKEKGDRLLRTFADLESNINYSCRALQSVFILL